MRDIPTLKQIKFATIISKRTGIPLPKEATFKAYFDYIASNKDAPDAPSISINQGLGEAKVTLFVKKMPRHCGECPFYQWNERVDDEPSWGDGVSHSCPFGCSLSGCLVERPSDCPLQYDVQYDGDYCGGLACQVED